MALDHAAAEPTQRRGLMTRAAIAASVPLLEPPGWALAERELFGLFDGTHYPWLDREARCYGFPLDWLLPDGAPEPERARDPRLAGQMTARMGTGDTAVNLAAAGLVLNAWILTGEPRYRDWIGQYVGAWRERAAANGGVVAGKTGPG